MVNIQGDEPLIDPAAIDAAILPLLHDDDIMMGTLKKRIEDPREIGDPNVVKVVTDRAGNAIYFSRSTIPYVPLPDGAARKVSLGRSRRVVAHYKHVGLVRLPPGFPAGLFRICPWDRSNRRSGWSSCARWRMATLSG